MSPVNDRPHFRHSATFRVMDLGEAHDELTMTFGPPEISNRRGHLRPGSTTKWPRDVWGLRSPLERERPLGDHLMWLAERLKPQASLIERLRESGATVDVFCGYTSDCDHAGFVLPAPALEFFVTMRIDVGVSVIVTVPGGQLDQTLRAIEAERARGTDELRG